MSPWLTRYDNASRPAVREAARDVGVRALLPVLGLLAVNLLIGFAIVGPGRGWRFEDALIQSLQAGRTPLLDALTRAASFIGSAPGNIGGCIVFVTIVNWRTRRWWVALLPGLALSLEAIVHAVTSTVVNRDRPAAAHLDTAQPTASFPSGHVGATLAQLLILLFLLHRVTSGVGRLAVVVLALGFVAFLAFSRLYLGMHHVSDVLDGVLNGIVCAALAWNYLRVRGGPGQVRA